MFKQFNVIYQEEADAGEGQGGGGSDEGGGDKPDEGGSLLDGGEKGGALSDGEYFLSDGIKGTGDKPDWYEGNHFKSVSEQAKGYSELQKKFGSFTGEPKDGYVLADGVDKEDGLVAVMMTYAKDTNMNQAGFDKGLELLLAQGEASESISREEEFAKLGDNPDIRIKNVETALRFHAGDNYDKVKDMITSADGVILAEALIKMFAPKKLPKDGGENPEGLTWAAIEDEMFKKDDNGNLLRTTSPEHEKKIQAMQKSWGGNEPDITTVS